MLSWQMMHGWLIMAVNHTPGPALRTRSKDDDGDNVTMQMMHGWLIRAVSHTCALRTRSKDDDDYNQDDD